jgi:hypothetical protein
MTSSMFPFVIDFLCQQRDVEVEVEVEVEYLNKLVVYKKVFSHKSF